MAITPPRRRVELMDLANILDIQSRSRPADPTIDLMQLMKMGQMMDIQSLLDGSMVTETPLANQSQSFIPDQRQNILDMLGVVG